MPVKLMVGVKRGGGPPPGYSWHVWFFDCVADETRAAVSEDQYWHLVDQVRDLAGEKDPTHCSTLSVSKIEDFYELREKHGPLGKINIRVFFWVDDDEKAIVILGVIKKEADGQTPVAIKVRMRHRLRNYRAGKAAQG